MIEPEQVQDRRRLRRWRLVLLALVACFAGVLAVVHLPAVRSRVLDRVVAALDDQGLRLEAGRLDYNLLALRVTMRDVVLTADHATQPFFAADLIRVDVPWRIVTGAIAMQSLEVERPRVTIARESDGRLNLPTFDSGADDESGIEGPIDIGRLLVTDLAVTYDGGDDTRIATTGAVTIDMTRPPGGPLDGRLSSTGTTTVRLARIDTAATVTGGDLAFDGRTLGISGLTVETPELAANVDGDVRVLGSDPALDLQYRVRVNAAGVAPWMDIAPAPTGYVEATGTLTGPFDRPVVGARVQSTDLTWPRIGAITVEGRAGWSASTITIDEARLTGAGGEVTAAGRIGIDDATSSELRARWSGIDLRQLLQAVPAAGVRLAAITDGSIDAAWDGRDITGGSTTVAAVLHATPANTGALPIEGTVTLRTANREWTLAARPQVPGALAAIVDARGRLAGQIAEIADSTIGGRVTVSTADVSAAVGRIERAGLAGDLALGDRLRGAVDAQVTLAGTIGAPRAAGTVDGRDLWLDRVGPVTVHTTVDASARDVALHTFDAALGRNTVTGTARIGIAANTIAGTATASLADLAAFGGAVPARWRPTGAATMTATLGGALDNPTVDAALTSQDVSIAGQTIRTIAAQARLDDGLVTVTGVDLTQDTGRLSLTGTYHLDTRAYRVAAMGRDLVVTPLAAAADEADGTTTAPVPIDVQFDFDLDGQGTIDDPRATAQVRVARAAWDGYQIGAARADVSVAGDRVEARATVPALAAAVDATIGIEARTFTTIVDVADADVARLVRRGGPAAEPADGAAPPAMSGAFSLRATAGGVLTDLDDATIAVDLTRATGVINGLSIELEQAAQVRYGGDTLEAQSFAVRIGGAQATARGRMGPGAAAGDALEIALTGTVADFEPLLQMIDGAGDVQATGDLALLARASGSFDAPDVLAYLTLTDGTFGTTTVPPATDVTLAASYSAGLVNVSTLTAEWQGASLAASIHVPAAIFGDSLPASYLASLPVIDAPVRGDVQVTGLTQAALEPFVPAETAAQITGRVDLVSQVEATAFSLDAVSADVTLTEASVELARLPLAQTHPTHLRFANRRLDVVEWSWAGAGSYFDVGGYVYFVDEHPQLNVGVSGSLDLRMISAVSRDIATTGRGELDVRALGTTDAPIIEGRLMLADADFVVRDPRVAVTDLNGEILFEENRVTVTDLAANANGGTLAMAGAIDYRDFALSGGKLTVTGRELALELVDDLRTEINLDLALGMTADAPQLTGRVTVVQGDYRRNIQLTEQLLALGTASVVVDDGGEPGAFDRLQLDVAVVSAEDLIVDNNYGRLDIATNVRIVGTGAAPVLAGRLTVREGGEVFLGGQTYQVRRGTVDFTNATRIEPNVNLVLETRVQRHDITLEVTGTPQTLDVGLRSPGLSQQDAASLVLTGQVAEESSMAYSEIARGQLLMLLSGELLSTAGRTIGLDSVQISRGLGGAASTFDLLATESNPETRLTLAKNLSRYLELIFSQSLRESGDITWIAAYRPTRRIEFRGTTDDTSSQTYEFRHELEFGGGPYARAAAPARIVSDEPYVAAVTVTTEPDVPESDIRGRLRLDAGDQFDYYRWQADRERILGYFHDRGQFEARVETRREPAADDRIILRYDVTGGPATTLVVDGYTLPSRVLARMRDAWSQAVFDGFLADDLEAMARDQLVADRRLQAAIDVTIDASADASTKTAAVHIVPGPRYAVRELAFDGNDALTDDALTAAAAARGLDDMAWRDPARAAAAMQDYYRSLGYLAAEVTAGDPTFENDRATLPLRVSEGAAYLLGTVDVAGVATRTPDMVREAANLQPGGPYRPATIEPARRRVEVEFTQAGYNRARVAAAVSIDHDRHLANVMIDVDEGPQQVLSEFEVSGADMTARSTIEDALDPDFGTPVDMSAYYLAQKRLYDLGVFQSVDVLLTPVTDVSPGERSEPMRASIVVQELPRFRFRYGFRATDVTDTIDGVESVGERRIRPGIVADLLNRNVLGRAIAAGVAGQLEKDRWLARGIVTLPTMFRLPVTTNAFITRSWQTFEDSNVRPYVENTLDLTLEQRFKPRRSMTVIWGYSFTRQHVFETGPDSVLPGDVRHIGRLSSTYAWDTRNDPSNASRGWFHSSGIEWGSPKLGSDLPFVRYLSQQFYFRPVGSSAVLASAVRLGLGAGLGQDRDLVESEKFYAGGSTTVRGFAEDSLGGIGGNSLLVLNQEVRFPIYRWFRGVAFLDAGNVFPTIRDLSPGRLAVGTGFGLRVNAPFAVLRVDFGMPLTDRDREPLGRWYFAFGQTF